jgi:molecular chaperone GrpE (heat shock protein)
MLAGGTIFAGCLLSWTAVLAALGAGHLKKFSTDVFRQCKEVKNKYLTEADATKERSKALIKSGWQNFNKNYADRHEPAPAQPAFSMRSEPCPDDSPENTHPVRNSTMGDMTQKGETSNGAQKIAVLLSDEKSIELEEAPDAEKCVCPPLADCNTSQNGSPLQNVRETALLDSPPQVVPRAENSLKSVDVRHDGFAPALDGDDALENSLTTQTEDFEKQVQEIKQMAQRVEQAAVEHSGPLNNTLVELTQEVAAIREYASNQQDRVKKLQEGYDWNIIKTFCLRIIRCIDNLENRISRLSEQDVKTPNLEEIKEELVFALESSGVERFEPEINSDYRGQEKSTEAVKEKEHCDDPNMKGKIAKVIRPGYQYFIDEENVKVVRAAQVKLFELVN